MVCLVSLHKAAVGGRPKVGLPNMLLDMVPSTHTSTRLFASEPTTATRTFTESGNVGERVV